MNISAIAAAVAIAAAATTAPAFAKGAPPAPPVAAVTTHADPSVDQRRVCVVSEVTGSLVPLKKCRTRAQWFAATGIDPLARR